MRKATQHARDTRTFFLPGFEPEDIAELETTGVVTLAPMTAPVMPVPTEIAMAVSVAADGVVGLTVVGDDDAQLVALQALDAEEASNDVQIIAPRKWDAFALDALLPPSGEVERIERNIEVLSLLKKLQETNATPTPEQCNLLLTYSGWGAVARIFEPELAGKHKERQAQLRALLTDDEWASARASTPNAHYTEPSIAAAMWSMVRQLGFSGGRVVEPSVGTGIFLAAMPEDIGRKSEITTIELDAVSAQIHKAVFEPRGVRTVHSALEKAKLPFGFYDLVIGNVPFGDYRVADTSRAAYANWSIHNWFIGRSLDLVRPGGLVAIITSSFTMEGNEGVRRWICAHAELVDAIRLPQGAFARMAKTDVVTDILIFKRRATPTFGMKEAWARAGEQAPEMMMADMSQETVYLANGKTVTRDRDINAWFAQRPHRVLGKLKRVSTKFGDSLVPVNTKTTQELAQDLDAIATSMPTGVFVPTDFAVPELEPLNDIKLQPLTQSKVGQFVMHGANLCISEGDTWVNVDEHFTGKLRERVIGLMKIRDAAKAVLQHQAESEDDVTLKSLQKGLNMYYDLFVGKLGFIHDRSNVRAFKSDPDMPLLLSLENYDPEEGVATKAAIFTQRTVNNRQLPTKAGSVRDALAMSLGRKGKVDIALMGKLLNKPKSKVQRELRDEELAYLDPVTHQWQAADEYLSGHIANKLLAAKNAGPAFAQNVRALEAVQPKPLGVKDVKIKLGAPWVPSSVVEDFFAHLLQIDTAKQKIAITYDQAAAAWSITGEYSLEYLGSHELRAIKWGTRERSCYELLLGALNQQPPTITVEVLGKRVVNKAKTLEAREKFEAIRDEFERWIYTDDSRVALLLDTYNGLFNQIVPREWNGSHMELVGLSSIYQPYASQLNAAWRCVAGGNTLLAHVVGAGKSLTMMIASMEMRRLGLAKKPVHVVPNHMLLQYTSEMMKAYPNANVLMADKDSLSGDKRREFAARIATGDWDAVVMTHGSFERLPMRPETIMEFVEAILDKVRISLQVAKDSGGRRSVKDLEKRMKDLEAKLTKEIESEKRDGLVYWDELGIDAIFYDEMHLAKNLFRISKMPRIAGLPNTSSQRSMDLLIKTRCLQSMLGGKETHFVGATATPLANSVAELHTMMRFMIPHTLERMGLDEFDAWAATFGETVTGLELAPDGSGYRMNTRFSRFQNLPELMNIFRLGVDIKTRAMLDLKTPAIEGGKPKVVVCKSSPPLKEYTAKLVERADKIRTGNVKPDEDNMLKVTHEGRLAAMDMRLLIPSAPRVEGGKMEAVVCEALRIYRETDARKGTQLIFSDIGTPKTGGAFSVYGEIRTLLVEAGIPEREIAFIHDYESDSAKDRLFRMVRQGQVRFLLGSTSKMGVGTNVQHLLKCVHQIDAPWRPCDIEQRDGRAERVGNIWESIELIRYVTEGSFDAYAWQTLEIKQGFIDQVMGGDATIRSIEDCSTSALTFAEIKAIASGNPMVLEKATIDADVLKLSTLKSLWRSEQYSKRSLVLDIQASIDYCERMLPHAPMVEKQARCVLSGAHALEFRVEQVRDACKGLTDLAEVLSAAINRALRFNRDLGSIAIGRIGDFEIELQRGYDSTVVVEYMHRPGIIKSVQANMQTSETVRSGLLGLFNKWSDWSEALMSRKEQEALRLERLQAEIDMPFVHEEKLQALLERQREIANALDLDKDTAGADELEPVAA